MNKTIMLYTLILFTTTILVGEKPNSEYTKSLIKNLHNEDPIERNRTAEKLVLQGEEILPELMKNFAKDNYLVRRSKAYVLGQIGTIRSLKYLLNVLQDKDKGVRNEAAYMLLNLSDKFSILEHLQKIKTTFPQVRDSIRDLTKSVIYKEVEKELIYYVSPDGSAGYFTGQFAKLQQKWQEKAILPLLEMFSNDKYEYVNNYVNSDRDIALQLRFLAGEGLADLKKVYTPTLRLHVKRSMDLMRRRAQSQNRELDNYIKGLVNKILYNIGYTASFDAELNQLKRRLFRNPQDYETLFEIGMKYLQIGDTKNGVVYLNKAVAVRPYNGITYYNLACAYSVAGKIDEAMVSLEKSVNFNYRDLDWMLKDGDLRNVRKHPRFKKLVKKLEKLNANK